MLKKTILNLFKVGITFGILYWLYDRGMLDLRRVHAVLTNVPVVVVTLIIFLCTNMAAVVRWAGLLEGQDLRLPFSETFSLTMIGVFFNTAIPGAVSGDVVKGFYVVRKQPNKRGRIKAFATLLIDRILGLSALICVSFVAMLSNISELMATPALKTLCGLISLLFAGVVVFYAFVLVEWSFAENIKRLLHKIPGVGELAGRFFEAIKAYESCREYIFRGFLISIGIHCAIVCAFILLSRTLGGFEHVPLSKIFFLVPFGLLVTAIPIAPAGLGTGHAAFFGLFAMVGTRAGADLFTAYVSFQIFISLLGGLFYLRYRSDMPTDFSGKELNPLG